MVKKTNVKSKKFYIIIATLCILSLHILDWTQTFNPTIQTNIEYLIILVILIAVPINPFYCSITIFIACILIYVIDDSYWITCYPFLFSIAIIAIYQGSILSACLAIIGTQLITIPDSMHIILLRHCCTFIHQYYPTSPLSKLGKKWLHRPYLFTRQSK